MNEEIMEMTANEYARFHYADATSQELCENDFKAGYVKGYEQAENNLGWISVKDRLPDTMDYVFTCIKMYGIPQCVGFHYYKDGIWWEGYEEHAVSAVEYWMPIPKFKDAEQ